MSAVTRKIQAHTARQYICGSMRACGAAYLDWERGDVQTRRVPLMANAAKREPEITGRRRYEQQSADASDEGVIRIGRAFDW